MADLPSLANTVPQVRAPTPGVSPSQVAEPYSELANTLNIAAKETGDVSKLLAHEAGLRAVTHDADGNLVVDKPPIFGDAALSFQHAVKFAALADGEGAARRDEIALRQQHHDDPQGYLVAADAYRQTKIKQYGEAAGTEVGIALGKAIDQQTTLTYKGLLNEQERVQLARSKAVIETEVDTKKNELYALAAQGVPEDAPEFQSRLSAIGAAYGQLASNPRLAVPREQIEAELSHVKSELNVARLGFQIGEVQKRDGVEAATAAADRVRTDPGLNLTPAERFTLHSRLMTGIAQRERGEEMVTKQIGSEISSIGNLVAQGNAVPPERMAMVRQAVERSKNPMLIQSFRETEAALPVIASWRKGNPAQLEDDLTRLSEMRRTGDSEYLAKLSEIGTKALDEMKKGIKSDPLGWANKSGAVKVPTIDFAAPNAVEQMRDRIAQSDAVGSLYRVAPPYLKEGEAQLLQATAAKGGQSMLDVAKLVVSGFDTRAPRVLAEIAKDSPTLAHVGGLMIAGGSGALIRDAADAVQLQQDKEFKIPHWADHPRDKVMAAQGARAVDTFGSAFFLEPDTGRAASDTARNAFFSRALRQGYTPLLDDNKGESVKAFDRALQESAGATYDAGGNQFGGIAKHSTGWFGAEYKVVAPGNVRADRFRQVMGAIKEDDLANLPSRPVSPTGKPYTAADVQGAIPVFVRGGYRLALDNPTSDNPRWMRGADGQPFVLDLEALEPALRKRVPGAYR